ncbi:SRPBCC domain-containing protein [Natronoglycomyces albus]|uniref:SRPBCC domain-containing protein n=1 Tax=Natronoglycomyces albus TaxID=2811108 RepID=A0A895XQI2_9ACTN|nr:SRPBCC domain-containing protein [Natronoglycomyces albus]QSB05629.1 SRPBCC domain-containing protein [Natronoglycomyces albus]
MEPKFSIAGRIDRPVEEVYEAVANPDQLSKYFTTGGAKGRVETGAVVHWDFADFPGEFPVDIVEAKPHERIVLRWDSDEDKDGDVAVKTTVTFGFESLADGRTLVTISEEGWRADESGLQASFGNCQGWTQMLCSMKAWLEHGITLRAGFYA